MPSTKADFKGTQSGLNEEKYQTALKEKHGHVRNDKNKSKNKNKNKKQKKQQLDYPCLQERAYVSDVQECFTIGYL